MKKDIISKGYCELTLKTYKSVSFIGVDDQLMLSLSCDNCKRDGRSVVLFKDSERSYCTGGRANQYTRHSYTGQVNKASFNIVQKLFTNRIVLKIDFQYLKNSDFGEFVGPELSWVRVHFKIRCNNCGNTIDCSTQTNISRPYLYLCRKCGKKLYKDYHSPGLFELN